MKPALAISLVLVFVFLAACAVDPAQVAETAASPAAQSSSTAAGSSAAGPSATPAGKPLPPTLDVALPTPEATSAPDEIPQAAAAAIEALAGELGIPANQIRLVSSEAVEWPDGCLGIQRMGVMCTQAIVPGFRIILEANGTSYEYHTNSDGSRVEQKSPLTSGGPGTPVVPHGIPTRGPAEEAAIEAFSAVTGIVADKITVVSSSPVEWPDSCLGVAHPGVQCAQAITPGYLVVLEAEGRRYEYHTDPDGTQMVAATLGLTWHREGGIAGFCDDLSIFLPGQVEASQCRPDGGKTLSAELPDVLSAMELRQFNDWLEKYGQVTVEQKDPPAADQMAITLTLYGTGSADPDEVEKQRMLAWAQQVYAALHSLK